MTTGSAVVRVSIKDVNDNEPYFEKEFYKAEVREDSFTGQSIITIAAKDADGEYLAAVQLLYADLFLPCFLLPFKSLTHAMLPCFYLLNVYV